MLGIKYYKILSNGINKNALRVNSYGAPRRRRRKRRENEAKENFLASRYLTEKTSFCVENDVFIYTLVLYNSPK